jgi:hypothetical protein
MGTRGEFVLGQSPGETARPQCCGEARPGPTRIMIRNWRHVVEGY